MVARAWGIVLRAALVLAALAACGSDRVLHDDADAALSVSDVAPSPDGPTFHPTYYDVASIVAGQCAGCHAPGGVAPFALATYDDLASRAESIAAVTASRSMPPWPADASGACGTFVDPRWLTDHELAVFQQWFADGMPLGAPILTVESVPRIERFTPAVSLASDLAYQIRPGPDEYRCFVVDPGLTEDRYITALAMQLDRADVVHHMQLFAADSAHAERSITQRDAADPAPGYPCDDEGVGSGLRYVGVWAGGDTIRRWPDATGIKLEAQHRLVIQLHYHNHGSEPVLDRSAVALELATSVEHVGRISSTQVTSFALPPHQPDVTISTLGGLPLGGPEYIRGARIHMHALGTSARMELVRGEQTSCVLEIPTWDVGWQLFYRFAQPIAVQPGDQIRIRCSYDTQAQVDVVEWGNGTEDEMCIAYTFLAP